MKKTEYWIHQKSHRYKLGTCWAPAVRLLGTCWAPSGHMLSTRLSACCALGGHLLGSAECLLGTCRAHAGHLMGTCRALTCKPLAGVLAVHLLGTSWALLGACCAPAGRLLGTCWALAGVHSLARSLARAQVALVESQGLLGACWGACWAPAGRMLGTRLLVWALAGNLLGSGFPSVFIFSRAPPHPRAPGLTFIPALQCPEFLHDACDTVSCSSLGPRTIWLS